MVKLLQDQGVDLDLGKVRELGRIGREFQGAVLEGNKAVMRQKRKEYNNLYRDIILAEEDMSQWDPEDREDYLEMAGQVAELALELLEEQALHGTGDDDSYYGDADELYDAVKGLFGL